MTIRSARADDAAAIAKIYNYFVTDTIITFEEVVVSDDEMAQRISEVQSRGLPWLVSEDRGRVVGFAYAGPFRKRVAYRITVESSVYLDIAQTGKGIGRQLYSTLIDQLKASDLHVAIGSISLPNEASVKLHESIGFTKTGHFSEVGFKFGRWIDVGYWELPLNSRGKDKKGVQ